MRRPRTLVCPPAVPPCHRPQAQVERRILSRTSHPFVVTLHGAFQTQDALMLVLELCPGMYTGMYTGIHPGMYPGMYCPGTYLGTPLAAQ